MESFLTQVPSGIAVPYILRNHGRYKVSKILCAALVARVSLRLFSVAAQEIPLLRYPSTMQD